MKGKKISWIALLIAFSVVGASIKIPAIVGSVALDVFPALVAAALFGRATGAIVGGLGHLVSSVIAGMPLGLFHFMIALEMAILVWLFAVLFQRGKRVYGGLLFISGNAFIAPIPFLFLMSPSFYVTLVPSLLIGSILNTALAFVLVPRLLATQRFRMNR